MKYFVSIALLVMSVCACQSSPTSDSTPTKSATNSKSPATQSTVVTPGQNKAQIAAEKPAAALEKPPADKPTSDEILYYTGTYAVTSPDGKQAFGPPIAVVAKRTFQKEQNLILEVLDLPKKHFEVTLTRAEGTPFTGTDKGKSWTGKIIYSGPEWKWNQWTYDIKMTDGSGTIKGSGSIVEGNFKTEKLFYDPTGTPQARILESLKATTAENYATRLKALKKTE